MNMAERDDNTGPEARLNAELRALMAAPVDVDRLLAGAERRIARWRRLRLLLPWLVAAVLAVALGPTAWRIAGGLAAALPGFGVSVDFSLDGLATLVHQLPVYVWAFVAGIGVTVATMIVER